MEEQEFFESILKTDRSELLVGKIDLEPHLVQAVKNLELPRHHPLIIHGRVCHPARNMQFYSDGNNGYKFSGKTTDIVPLTKELREILDIVNDLLDDEYNGILVNKYVDGTDYIDLHSDSQVGLSSKSGLLVYLLAHPVNSASDPKVIIKSSKTSY